MIPPGWLGVSGIRPAKPRYALFTTQLFVPEPDEFKLHCPLPDSKSSENNVVCE